MPSGFNPVLCGKEAQYWALPPPNMRSFHAINPENDAFQAKKRRPEMGRPVIYTVGFGFILLEFLAPDRVEVGVSQAGSAGLFVIGHILDRCEVGVVALFGPSVHRHVLTL